MYFEEGDYDRAIADNSEALRINPDYAEVYSNRGNAYKLKGDYDRAIADWGETIRIYPKVVALRVKPDVLSKYKALGRDTSIMADVLNYVADNPEILSKVHG